jgi:hypothetical protein
MPPICFNIQNFHPIREQYPAPLLSRTRIEHLGQAAVLAVLLVVLLTRLWAWNS